MLIYASNGWMATYNELNPDGSLYANITDNNGKQYAYRQHFDSLSALKAWLENR